MLSNKHANFVKIYFETGDIEKAVYGAGYNIKNSSSARATGKRLLQRVDIKTILDAKQEEKRFANQEVIKDILRDLKIGWNADLTDYVNFGKRKEIIDKDNNKIEVEKNYIDLKDQSVIAKDKLKFLKKISITDNGAVKIEMMDKLAILDRMFRLFGIDNDKDDRPIEEKLKEKIEKKADEFINGMF